MATRSKIKRAVLIGVILMVSSLATAQEDEGDIQFAPDEDPATSEDQSDMMYKDEDEQPAAKTPPPAEPPAPVQEPAKAQEPATSTATPTPDAADAETPTLDLSGGRRDVLFGSYRVRIGLARPKFDKIEFYENLYGKENWYPTIAADWFFWDWYATLGLSFRGGFYTAEGKAAQKFDKPVNDVTSADVKKDDNSTTNLTLLPLQLCLTAEITPLRRKWLVVDGYIGYESLYYQEVRSSGSSSKTAMIQTEDSAEATDDALTNRGTQRGTVLGFSANILLNGIDEQSANSMRGSMGLGNIYMSPFMEYARTLDKRPDFSRTTMGIGFTFESIK